MNRRELDRVLDEHRKRIVREVGAAVAEVAAELRREYRAELEALERRLDTVHRQALRALTDKANRKG